jgi:5'-3' exonuclease
MIIIDLNQVMISNLMMQLGNHTNAQLEENMVRHMVLNAIRSFNQKFSREYGEIVIACDNTNNWRKKEFPYYKANRKKNQEKSELDWKSIFDCLGKIRQELKDYFPYRVIDVESAEADDIIATLVHTHGKIVSSDGDEKILILSGDKDFIQLHIYSNVRQYDPVRKKFIEHNDPERFLKEHILKGDSGDGVPNILSADDCFVVGQRQKPLTAKKMDAILEEGLEGKINHPLFRNFKRNMHLINLSFTPWEIKEKILAQYDEQDERDRSKMLNYFITNRLKNLMESIGEF